MLPHIESSNPRAAEYINLPIFTNGYNDTENVTQGAEPWKENVEVGMRNAEWVEFGSGNAEWVEFGIKKKYSPRKDTGKNIGFNFFLVFRRRRLYNSVPLRENSVVKRL